MTTVPSVAVCQVIRSAPLERGDTFPEVEQNSSEQVIVRGPAPDYPAGGPHTAPSDIWLTIQKRGIKVSGLISCITLTPFSAL